MIHHCGIKSINFSMKSIMFRVKFAHSAAVRHHIAGEVPVIPRRAREKLGTVFVINQHFSSEGQ